MIKSISSTGSVRGITQKHVCESLGILPRKLQRWMQMGLVGPSLQNSKGGKLSNGEPNRNIFSKTDWIEIKTIVFLREAHVGMKTVKNIITVDQIRVVTDALNKTAGLGSSKVCLIYPADMLNLNAANALLKSLEEPAGGTYFLLLSSFPGTLPATIRSRCSRLDLDNPTAEECIDWLTTEHKVDLKVAQQLIAHGLGPHEVLQMNTREDLEAHQELIVGLAGLISGNVSAGAFTRQSGIYDIVLTLKVIRSEIYRGLKESVKPDHVPDVPVLISPDLALEFREVLFSVYSAIGRFLSWPKKSVDEQLFLEDIALKLSFPKRSRT